MGKSIAGPAGDETIQFLKAEVDSWSAFSRRIHDALELAQLDDESLRAELEAEISAIETELEKRCLHCHAFRQIRS